MISEAIDFKYLLLDSYKKLKIKENELAVIFVMDHLISQGNHLVTADLLSLKMNLTIKEIDTILANLLKKNLIDYETKKNKTITTLNPLKEKLYSEFDYNRKIEKENKANEEIKEELNNVFESYQKLLGRSLSPVEIQTIREWINFGYTDEEIINALKDALSKNKKSLKAVDSILLSYQIRNDREGDGISPINDEWNKNLEETIKIIKTPWLKNNKK